MRELVLGGAGLIGTCLVTTLRAKGHEVVSHDLRTGCDLRFIDPDSFQNADRVWFLAWDTGGAKYLHATDKQHQMYKNNCELSAKVFDALERTKKPFLFATSQLAGQPNAYGLTKLMAEHWAAQLGGKVARLWNVYGWEDPGTKSHVITDLVLSGLVRGRIECLTSGSERRRFLYKEDCALGLMTLFDGADARGDLAGSEWVSIRTVAAEIAEQLSIGATFGTAAGDEVMIDPIQPVSGWRPTIPLKEGIARVVAEAQRFLASVSLLSPTIQVS